MPTPKPPYGPNDVSTPLTPDQRNTIVTWIPEAAAWAVANGWNGQPLPANYATLPDDQLLKLYGLYYAMVSLKIPGITLNPLKAGSLVNPFTGQDVQNPIVSLEQFLTLLTSKNLWLRVAEFSIGTLVLVVGLNAILRPGRPISIPKVLP